MDDFRKIKVGIDTEGKLKVMNPTRFPIISMGRHGALFNLLDGRCVKIYAKEEYAKIESEAYIKANGSAILPELYEVGNNYLVIEYIEGSDLREYILNNGQLSDRLVGNLAFMFLEMKKIGFFRMDESLRHIIVKPDESVKIVDHFYAYTLRDIKPVKFFKQLNEIGVLCDFLKKVKSIDSRLYAEWSLLFPEFFNRTT